MQVIADPFKGVSPLLLELLLRFPRGRGCALAGVFLVEVNTIPTLFSGSGTKECGGLHLEERFKNPEACSSAWWQQNGVRLEIVEVVNYYGSYVLLCHISEKR